MVRMLYHLVMSFGMMYLCITPRLSLPQQYVLQLFQPLVLLFLMLVLSRLARNVKVALLLQRFHRRSSLTRVLWLILLQTYGHIASTCIALLECVRIKESKVSGVEEGLYMNIDARIKCYTGDHLVYGILASVILAVLFLLPVVLLLFWRRVSSWPILKGLLDEATHIYEDNRRWWVAINLLRRIVIAFVAIHASRNFKSSVYFSLTLLFYLILHDFLRFVKNKITQISPGLLDLTKFYL